MSYKTNEEALAACEILKTNFADATYYIVQVGDIWEIHVRLHGAIRQVSVNVRVDQGGEQ